MVIFQLCVCFVVHFSVADVVKKALNMSVWGLVRTPPSDDSHCSSIDKYRWTISIRCFVLMRCASFTYLLTPLAEQYKQMSNTWRKWVHVTVFIGKMYGYLYILLCIVFLLLHNFVECRLILGIFDKCTIEEINVN